MGLNQSTAGSAKNSALINLHLATGQIGRPGCGPFSLTGQPNAWADARPEPWPTCCPVIAMRPTPSTARGCGVLGNRAPAGGARPACRRAVRCGPQRANQGLWIVCTNPAQSLPDQHAVHQALATCPFVVVQEAFATTETCRYADLLLPAASWGEKAGTVTNSERRISPVRAAVSAPGEARPDWAIACDFARRLERHLRPGRPSLFAFERAEQLYDEYRQLTAGRDLDYSGLSRAQLGASRPAAMAVSRRCRTRYATPVRRRPLPHRVGARALRGRPLRVGGRRRRFGLSAGAQYRPTARSMARHERTGTAAQLFGHVEQALLGLHPEIWPGRAWRGRSGPRTQPTRQPGAASTGGRQPAARPGLCADALGDRFLEGLGVNALSSAACDPLRASRNSSTPRSRSSQSPCPGHSSPWSRATCSGAWRRCARCSEGWPTPASAWLAVNARRW